MSPSRSDPEPTLRGYSEGQRVFGRYVLRRILGRGGMGVVWAAWDETLGGEVALKFLPDSVRWDPGAFEDLKAETRRARQLSHPNIVRIHDFVEDASGAAISMEVVDGRTLAQWRCEKPGRVIDAGDIVPWLTPLCAALDYAHTGAKVIHRDLKPSNIMLTRDGVVKVGDFGIARSLADSITRVSMMSAGTLVYMSPQQAMGEEPSPADDIYSLGATLYEMLAGKPPFHTGDVRVQLFHRKPESIAARRRAAAVDGLAELPARWERVIAACLAKEPAERPASAGEVANQLTNTRERSGSAGQQNARVGGREHERVSGRERERVDGIARRFIHSLILLASRTVTFRGARRKFWAAFLIVVVAATGVAWWASRPAPVSRHASDVRRAAGAWNFDGNSKDASGHGLDVGGWNNTVPTTDRHGRIDRALQFNGASVIQTPESPLLLWAGDEPFSISVWVRPDALRPQGNRIAGVVPSSVGECYWYVDLLDNGRARLWVSRFQEEGVVYADSSGELRAGEWAHVAGVSDGRAIRMYVDAQGGAEVPLVPSAIGRRPKSARLRAGTTDMYGRWAYSGALDDLRVWRRPLAEAEVRSLASREVPPRLLLSRGTYSERDDLAAAVRSEFGPQAVLGDWETLKRWHEHDIRAWCDEVRLPVLEDTFLLQRGGERLSEGPRHYFATRFSGTRPEYFLAHDELGGMALALGSWYGQTQRTMVQLPGVTPWSEKLTADGNGDVRRTIEPPGATDAVAFSWQAALRPAGPVARCEVRRRDGEEVLVAVCTPAAADQFALTLGSRNQPQVARQLRAGWGEFRFTVVIRDREMRFRAVNVTSGMALFQESIVLPELRAAEVVELVAIGAPAAQLIVE